MSEISVNAEYRGLALGKDMTLEDFVADSAFLQHPAPMPVGAELRLLVNGSDVELVVKVTRVTEQVAGCPTPGMLVQKQELTTEAEEWWDSQSSQKSDAPEPLEAKSKSSPPAEAGTETVHDENAASSSAEEASPKKKRRRRKKK